MKFKTYYLTHIAVLTDQTFKYKTLFVSKTSNQTGNYMQVQVVGQCYYTEFLQ